MIAFIGLFQTNATSVALRNSSAGVAQHVAGVRSTRMLRALVAACNGPWIGASVAGWGAREAYTLASRAWRAWRPVLGPRYSVARAGMGWVAGVAYRHHCNHALHYCHPELQPKTLCY